MPFLFFLVISSFLACQTMQEAPQKSHLTAGSAKVLLVKGKTTQADIVKVWGSPNIATQSSSGEKVWTYSRQSYDTKTASFAGGLLVIGGGQAVSKSTVSSFDVVITFDENDIVKKFFNHSGSV